MSDHNTAATTVQDEQVLAVLRKVQASSEKVRAKLGEPLAVIGIGCRFPRAGDSNAFWQLLANSRSGVIDTPADRRQPATIAAANATHRRKGAFLDAVDQFDAGFFGIAGREAATLDPQQRLLLEVTWETLEDATIDPQRLKGSRTGVFVGICSSDYWTRLGADPHGAIDAYWGTGNAHGVSAGRLSYVMDWRGPCAAFDTACSSSLTALHFATRSLRYGDCDLALVAGVNLMLIPELTISFDQAGMLSTVGACQTFAAGADGFVRGEGCGAVLLKRLSQAEADGDRIYCLVRGTAVNQDGRSIGLTAPNGVSQQAVIRRALADARVEAEAVDYVEAHGTGTPLGDPIEMGALAAVFATNRQRSCPLQVGSVKTNIGHLEAAAGIAGLIKVCLSLEHQAIPPHLHFDEPSPHIDWTLPLEVPTSLRPWPRGERTRLAGVSSFGFGGTNAHVVLAEAPRLASPTEGPPDRPQLLTISAKSPTALKTQATNYAKALEDTDSVHDFCYTAKVGRAHFDHRLVVIGSTADELAEKLDSFAKAEPSAGCLSSLVEEDATIGWRFDDGVVDFDALQAFCEFEPRFSESLQRYVALFPEMTEQRSSACVADLRRWACAPESIAVLFCAQLAAADLWLSWGVGPHRVLALGMGEYAAACVAGVFAPGDAAELIRHHMEILRPAAPRGSKQQAYFSAAADIAYQPPRYEYRTAHSANGADSNVDCQEYWQRYLERNGAMPSISPPSVSLRLPLPADGLWVEIGPCYALAGVDNKSQGGRRAEDLSVSRNTCLGQLYLAGVPLEWRKIEPGRRRTTLPTYPFERKRHWYDSGAASRESTAPINAAVGGQTINPFLGRRLDVAGQEIFFETDLAQVPYLEHHRIGSTVVLPMAGFLELALSAGWHAASRAVCVQDMQIHSSLVLSSGQARRVQVVVTPGETETTWRCQILARESSGWRTHAECRLADEGASFADLPKPPTPTDVARKVGPEEHYAHFRQRGLHHGPAFSGLRQLWVGDEEAWGEVNILSSDDHDGYLLHPAVLDACLQVVVGALGEAREGAWLPVRAAHYAFDSDHQLGKELRVYARQCPANENKTLQVDLDIRNARGENVAIVAGLVLKPVPAPLAQTPSETARMPQVNPELIQRILQSAPEDRQLVIQKYLLTSVADIAGLNASEIPPDKPLDRLGIDSMMALEVQQDLQQNLGIRVGMERLMQDLTLNGLGLILLDALLENGGPERGTETITSQRFVEGAL